MRSLALLLFCSALMAGTAAAQTNSRWLIVPATSSQDAKWVEPTVSRASSALIEAGATVQASNAAAARFESEASAPPAALSKRDLERWVSLSTGAVDDLAEGDNKKALQKLNAAQDISRAAIEELNRDPARATRVFDTCLYQVRAVLATESKSSARSAARECRQLVPRAEPTPRMHPPAVTDLLREMDALQARQTGALRVESTPSGCPARLNGVLLGETPVSIGEFFPGRYRVQVECNSDERGRVHFVTVGAGRAERRVDARFDDSIVTRPALRLSYADPRARQEHGAADARHIAREVAAGSVVLLSRPDAATVQLELFETAGDSSAPAAFVKVPSGPTGPSKSDLASAARALTSGECMDFTSAAPVMLRCPDDEPVAAAKRKAAPVLEGRRPRGQFVAGVTLASLGLAGLVTGYALVFPRKNAAEDWLRDTTDTTAQEQWLNLRNGIIASASVGSAALVTAMPLALPERIKTPWWAWTAGVIGLGLAGTSVALGVTAPEAPNADCDKSTTDFNVAAACIQHSERTTYAVLTGLTAAPLITMPLVYLFRPSRAHLQPSVDISRSGAFLGLSGRF